jgi:hypothetical protein
LISAQPKSRLVIPANAGIQAAGTEILDSRLRRNDKQNLLGGSICCAVLNSFRPQASRKPTMKIAAMLGS